MAKIKKEKLIVRDPNSDSLKDSIVVEFDIFVDTNGYFYTTLPEDITIILMNQGIELVRNGKTKKFGYFIENSLDNLILSVKNKILDVFNREIISDSIIIRYSIQTSGRYYLNKNSEIVPNGEMEIDGVEYDSKRWRDGINNGGFNSTTEHFPFSFQIYAIVQKKITYKYRSGQLKTEYLSLSDEQKEGKYYLNWLLRIIKTKAPEYGVYGEIPYTEENAKFFVDLIKVICNLSEKIQPIFSEEKNLLSFIQKNKTNLLE